MSENQRVERSVPRETSTTQQRIVKPKTQNVHQNTIADNSANSRRLEDLKRQRSHQSHFGNQ